MIMRLCDNLVVTIVSIWCSILVMINPSALCASDPNTVSVAMPNSGICAYNVTVKYIDCTQSINKPIINNAVALFGIDKTGGDRAVINNLFVGRQSDWMNIDRSVDGSKLIIPAGMSVPVVDRTTSQYANYILSMFSCGIDSEKIFSVNYRNDEDGFSCLVDEAVQEIILEKNEEGEYVYIADHGSGLGFMSVNHHDFDKIIAVEICVSPIDLPETIQLPPTEENVIKFLRYEYDTQGEYRIVNQCDVCNVAIIDNDIYISVKPLATMPYWGYIKGWLDDNNIVHFAANQRVGDLYFVPVVLSEVETGSHQDLIQTATPVEEFQMKYYPDTGALAQFDGNIAVFFSKTVNEGYCENVNFVNIRTLVPSFNIRRDIRDELTGYNALYVIGEFNNWQVPSADDLKGAKRLSLLDDQFVSQMQLRYNGDIEFKKGKTKFKICFPTPNGPRYVGSNYPSFTLYGRKRIGESYYSEIDFGIENGVVSAYKEDVDPFVLDDWGGGSIVFDVTRSDAGLISKIHTDNASRQVPQCYYVVFSKNGESEDILPIYDNIKIEGCSYMKLSIADINPIENPDAVLWGVESFPGSEANGSMVVRIKKNCAPIELQYVEPTDVALSISEMNSLLTMTPVPKKLNGIDEVLNNLEDERPIYYNIYGVRINPEKGTGVCVEIKGEKRRKIIL